MIISTEKISDIELDYSLKEKTQLLTELRFLLEHSVETRKVSVKQYFSLLLTFNQKANAKKLKDHFHKSSNHELRNSIHHKALLEIFLRVFSEYKSIYLDSSSKILWKLIDHLLIKISNFSYCKNCYNWQIGKLLAISKKGSNLKKLKYYCPNCKDRVDVYEKFDLFPVFLEYLVDLSNEESRFKKVKKKLFKWFGRGLSADSKKHQNLIILLYEIFEDLYNYSVKNEDIKSIFILWVIGQKFGFSEIFSKKKPYSIIEDHLVKNIEKADFSDYSLCLDIIQKISPPGKYSFQDFYLKGGIQKNIIRSISNCNMPIFLHSFNFGLDHGLINSIEFLSSTHFIAACYRGLFNALKDEKYSSFKELVRFIKENFIDVKLNNIPNRFSILNQNLLNNFKSRRLDQIFKILKFGCEYNLFEFKRSDEINLRLNKYKKNYILMNCLENLLNINNPEQNDQLLYFIYEYLPPRLIDFFSHCTYLYEDIEDLIDNLHQFLDNYTIYGLSLKKIAFTSHFMRYMNTFLEEKFIDNDKSEDIFELNYANRTILISISNFIKIKKRIHKKKRYFEFLLLGMVVKGGLGPQGMGFVYFTPRGELVEICSDAKESKAYIVVFKQFLKDDFITELHRRIKNLSLTPLQENNLIEILGGHISSNLKFGYTKEEFIVKQVEDFLEDEFDFNRITSSEKTDLFEDIALKIHAIFTPITLIDQYLCRLKLIAERKVEPGEIAKLTSLGEITHFNLLTERYFYQSILKAVKNSYDYDGIAPNYNDLNENTI